MRCLLQRQTPPRHVPPHVTSSTKSHRAVTCPTAPVHTTHLNCPPFPPPAPPSSPTLYTSPTPMSQTPPNSRPPASQSTPSPSPNCIRFQPTPDQILYQLQFIIFQRDDQHDGAASALNAVFQLPLFTHQNIMELTNMCERDPYAINQVLNKFNLTLEPIHSRSSTCALVDELAFLLYEHKRWHTFRRVGVHWMNLSDGLDRPRCISSTFLPDALLHKQRELYSQLFTVRGHFLPSAVDNLTFWDTPFTWLTDVHDDNGHTGTDCYTIQGDYCASGKCLGQLRCACEHNNPRQENERLLRGGFEADLMATLDVETKRSAQGDDKHESLNAWARTWLSDKWFTTLNF